MNYSFAKSLYSSALDAIVHLRHWGKRMILSQGDVVFQPHRIQRSGLWDAVEGRVLIYVPKEQILQDVERHFPARHYVIADDKLRILAAVKQVWGDRLVTDYSCQQHYPLAPGNIAGYPRPTRRSSISVN